MKRKTMEQVKAMSDMELYVYHDQLEKYLEILAHNSLFSQEPMLTEDWVVHIDEVEAWMDARKIDSRKND